MKSTLNSWGNGSGKPTTLSASSSPTSGSKPTSSSKRRSYALWHGFGTYQGRSTEKTWVYRVALNTCINLNRKHHRPDTSPLQMDIDLYAEEQGCPAAARLHKHIGKLHPFDRALILLWLEGLPYDEIAAILGITVKKRQRAPCAHPRKTENNNLM